MFLPTMTSRLMLSLKKVGAEPAGLWSLSTTGDLRRGRSPDDGTVRFASNVFDVSHGFSETLPPPNEENIELDSMPKLPWDHGSQQLC